MTPTITKRFQDEDFFLYRLPVVARKSTALCAEQYLAEFGMKVPEWRLLAQVGRFGSICAKDLSDKISMDQVAISRAVNSCVKRGLIKEVINPADRRQKVMALTVAGQKFLDRFLPSACSLAARMEECLTEKESRQLRVLLSKLDRHLDGMTSTSRADNVRSTSPQSPKFKRSVAKYRERPGETIPERVLRVQR